MTDVEEFTVHLISSASMDVYGDNTLACFRNVFQNSINLEGDWRVALSSIIYPDLIQNVTDGKFKAFKKKEEGMDVTEVQIPAGIYRSINDIFKQMEDEVPFFLTRETNKFNGKITLRLNQSEALSFHSKQIPSLLGFTSDKIVGHCIADYPADIFAGCQMMFIYLDIIDYQLVGDSKSPLLRVINIENNLDNGRLSDQSTNLKSREFDHFEYKKVIKASISSIKVELRTETGKLVPFYGTGKVLLTLHFKKFA